jgi:predicted NAD/FAD-binding protein
MSFAVTRDDGAFEWGGENLFTVFCQLQNLFKGSFWRMIWDVLRFNASARRLLSELEERGRRQGVELDEKGREEVDILSLGDYLSQNGYSDSFRDDYLMVRGSLSDDGSALTFGCSPWRLRFGRHHQANVPVDSRPGLFFASCTIITCSN